MANKQSYLKEEFNRKVELANRVSIIDYARKKGMEITDEDDSMAITIDPDTDSDLIIYKDSNSWKVELENDEKEEENTTYGNTIRFVARVENIPWKKAMEKLLEEHGKYQSAADYNAGYEEKRKQAVKEQRTKEAGNRINNTDDMQQKAKQTDKDIINSNASQQSTSEKPSDTEEKKPSVITKENTDNTTKQSEAFQQNYKNLNQQNLSVNAPAFRRTFTKEQLAEVLAGIKRGINVAAYDNVSLRPEQMRQIRLAVQNNINPKAFNYSFVPADYMQEVRLALQRGTDIRLLEIKDNYCIYSAKQAREIRMGLENGLSIDDVKGYAMPDINPDIMREIRLGLQDGFEQIKALNPVNYSAKDIHTIRMTLTIDKLIETIAVQFRNLYEKILEIFHKIIEDHLYQQPEASNEAPVPEDVDMENEADQELKTTAAYIYEKMEMDELPMEKKQARFADAMQKIATNVSAMENSIDEKPQVILDESVEKIIEAQSDFALQQQAYENLKDEYLDEFFKNEEDLNIKQVEFTDKVMKDNNLSKIQKTEIVNEAMGSIYGNIVAHEWADRFEEHNQDANSQDVIRAAYQNYELQQTITEEMEMEL